MGTLSFMVGANLDILKVNLNAIVKKADNQIEALVLPANLQSAPALTLDGLKEELKTAFGMNDTTSIEAQMKSMSDLLGVADIGNLTFKLSQIFFYFKSENTAPTEEKVVEYAFAITIITENALPSLGFLKLNSISLAVWNTKWESVLHTLNIGDFSKMLPQ